VNATFEACFKEHKGSTMTYLIPLKGDKDLRQLIETMITKQLPQLLFPTIFKLLAKVKEQGRHDLLKVESGYSQFVITVGMGNGKVQQGFAISQVVQSFMGSLSLEKH
jgi:hypothetical protein